MQSSPENTESSPIVPSPEMTSSFIKNANPTEKLELFPRVTSVLSTISSQKSIIGGLIFLGIIATFFIFTKGTEICLWSDCSKIIPPPVVTPVSEFLAFAGGAGTLIVLTTLVGMPLLPAVALSTGVWLVMQYFH
jgi:hypothetical protein